MTRVGLQCNAGTPFPISLRLLGAFVEGLVFICTCALYPSHASSVSEIQNPISSISCIFTASKLQLAQGSVAVLFSRNWPCHATCFLNILFSTYLICLVLAPGISISDKFHSQGYFSHFRLVTSGHIVFLWLSSNLSTSYVSSPATPPSLSIYFPMSSQANFSGSQDVFRGVPVFIRRRETSSSSAKRVKKRSASATVPVGHFVFFLERR
jgi:hypothetical protein